MKGSANGSQPPPPLVAGEDGPPDVSAFRI